MPDEITAPEPSDTPDAVQTADPTGTPAGGDWESRYKELQATYTRASQEAAQHRQIIESLTDPEKAPEVFAQLGYEFATPDQEPEPEPQYDDPYEAQLAELKNLTAKQQEQLSQLLNQQQQAQQQSERESHLLQSQAALEQELGRSLGEQELEAIFRLADTMPDSSGKPQVKAAYEFLDKLAAQEFDRRLDAKRNAPRPPAGGQPGAPSPDLSTRKGRLEQAMSLMETQQLQ